MEQFDRLGFGPLEGVAPYDAPEASAPGDAPDLLEERVFFLRRPAGENHDPPTGEGALDDVGDALGQVRNVDVLLDIDFPRGLLLDLRGRGFYLDDVRAP